jgi:hypothetical protein
MAGYSGAPLAKKLGFKAPLQIVTFNAPAGYSEWLGELPPGITLMSGGSADVASSSLPEPLRAAHIFGTRRTDVEKRLKALRRALDPVGFVWVSWPKKASKVETDITGDTVREMSLPLGFVDIKVCAVTDVWSALKLVIRKSERPDPTRAARP